MNTFVESWSLLFLIFMADASWNPRPYVEMGRPGLPGEKVSDAQLSGAPDAPGDAPDDDIDGTEDSDLVPSVTLGTALILLFLLMSFWLAWPRCHTSY